MPTKSNSSERFQAIVQLGKRFKENHAEAELIHSPRTLFYILQIRKASFIISNKQQRKINMFKMKIVQELLLNRSTIDFIKYTRQMIDPALYYALVTPDETELSKEDQKFKEDYEKIKGKTESIIDTELTEMDKDLDLVLTKHEPEPATETVSS